MASLYTHRDANLRKTILLMSVFLILVIGLGWIFSYVFNSPLILYIAIALSLVMNFLSYWYSDQVVLAMTKAKPLSFQENPELHRIVENLAISAGLPKPRIYILNEVQPNAFATGRDPEHSVIAITTGLLEKLDRSELEGVLAHELAHIGNRDILVSTVAVVLAGFIAIACDIFLRSMSWHRFDQGDRQKGGVWAIVLVLALIFAILAPLAATLIRLAISRSREFLADATGALITRYPEGLARALEKIALDPSPMRVASEATAHLFLTDPFRGKRKTSWLHKLFMTHPPVEERIAVLRGMQL